MGFRNNQYPIILTLTVLNLFGLVLFLPKSNSVLFIREFYFLIIVLLFVAIGLFSVARGIVMGWLLFAVFFAVNMFNEFYIFSSNFTNTLLFIVLIITGLFGFIFSLSSLIKKTKRIKRARKAERKKLKNKLDSAKQKAAHATDAEKPVVVYDSSSESSLANRSEKKKASKNIKKKAAKAKKSIKSKMKKIK
jgi:hypothetical protein